MSVNFVLAWWHVPAIITLIGLAWAILMPLDDAGMFYGIARVFRLGCASFIIAIAWAIAGALK